MSGINAQPLSTLNGLQRRINGNHSMSKVMKLLC